MTHGRTDRVSHTPGPWHCGTFRESGKAPGIDIGAENNSNVGIAHHQASDRTAYETKANARLIAAAPDLLAALEPFANFACDVQNDCHNCRARAAIAKAFGY